MCQTLEDHNLVNLPSLRLDHLSSLDPITIRNNEIGKWDSDYKIEKPSTSKQYAFAGLPFALLGATMKLSDFAKVVDLVELELASHDLLL